MAKNDSKSKIRIRTRVRNRTVERVLTLLLNFSALIVVALSFLVSIYSNVFADAIPKLSGNVLISLVALFISLVFGVPIVISVLARRFNRERAPENFETRFGELTTNLKDLSKQMDSALAEANEITQVREQALKELETRLKNTLTQEDEARKRMELLEATNPAVVEYLEQALERREKVSGKRSWRQNTVWFALGSGVNAVFFVLGIWIANHH